MDLHAAERPRNQLAGYLPNSASAPEPRRHPPGSSAEELDESVAGVGDCVVEAVALDALGRLPPGALRAWLIGTRTEFRRDAASGPREVLLDVEWDQLARRDATNPGLAIHGDQVAYVLYTSGSTGRPKGVMGSHRATLNRLEWMYETYPFEPREVCCAKASLNFVDSIWELFGPLLKGVPTVLLPAALNYDLDAFTRTLARFRVTRLVLVPSLLRTMLETADGDPPAGLKFGHERRAAARRAHGTSSARAAAAAAQSPDRRRTPPTSPARAAHGSDDGVGAIVVRSPTRNPHPHRDLNPVPVGVREKSASPAGPGAATRIPDLPQKFVPNR